MANQENHHFEHLFSHNQLITRLHEYDRYLLAVLRKRYRKVASDSHHAQELIQDVFLKALCKIESFRGVSEEEWRGWLRTILHRCVLNFVERHSTRFESLTPLPAALPTDDPSPLEQTIAAEEAGILKREVAQLPPDDWEAIEAILHDVSTADLASHLGLSEEAVRQRRCRALQHLRSHVNNGHGD